MGRAEQFEDLEMARLEAIQVVMSMMATRREDDTDAAVAQEIVDELFVTRPDLVTRLAYPGPKRFWVSRGFWSLPRVFRAGDEFGNDTVALALGPFLLVLVTNLRLRRIPEPAGGRVEDLDD